MDGWMIELFDIMEGIYINIFLSGRRTFAVVRDKNLGWNALIIHTVPCAFDILLENAKKETFHCDTTETCVCHMFGFSHLQINTHWKKQLYIFMTGKHTSTIGVKLVQPQEEVLSLLKLLKKTWRLSSMTEHNTDFQVITWNHTSEEREI